MPGARGFFPRDNQAGVGDRRDRSSAGGGDHDRGEDPTPRLLRLQGGGCGSVPGRNCELADNSKIVTLMKRTECLTVKGYLLSNKIEIWRGAKL